MITSPRRSRRAQKVVNGLNFRGSGRTDATLRKLGEPIALHSCPGSDLPLTQSRFVDKLICALQKVHCLILEKYYPVCKQNFTRVSCDNVFPWEKPRKITSRQRLLPLLRQQVYS